MMVGGISRIEWHGLAGAKCIAWRDARGDPISSLPPSCDAPETRFFSSRTNLCKVFLRSVASLSSPESKTSNSVTPEFLLMAAATQPPDKGGGRGTQIASANFGSFILSTPSHLPPSRLDASCTSHTCMHSPFQRCTCTCTHGYVLILCMYL